MSGRDPTGRWVSLGLKPGMQLQVIEYRDRVEFLPIRKAFELRGLSKGLDPAIERESDRFQNLPGVTSHLSAQKQAHRAGAGTTRNLRSRRRASLRNRRQNSNLLKDAQTIHLRPGLHDFPIFDPVDGNTLVGNLASGWSDTGKRSAMGSL